jgi:hypothetical protein
MKLKEILAIESSLKKLLGTDLPIRVSYRLGKFTKKVGGEVEAFTEARTLLFKKMGALNEAGNLEVKGDEETKLFLETLNALLDEEVDIEIPKITLEELDGIKLSPIDTSNILFLIQE